MPGGLNVVSVAKKPPTASEGEQIAPEELLSTKALGEPRGSAKVPTLFCSHFPFLKIPIKQSDLANNAGTSALALGKWYQTCGKQGKIDGGSHK